MPCSIPLSRLSHSSYGQEMEMEMEMEPAVGAWNDRNKSFSTMPIPATLVTNGTVDIRGRTADKTRTGGWRAAPFIIVNEVVERMAFYAIAVNMVTYLVREMHQPLPSAATHVSDWIGAAFMLTILGAFLADAYLGRFLTIVIFTCIYSVGMVLLTLSASIESLRPPPCVGAACAPATTRQTAFLYVALSLISLGTGGIKPCVSSFGADQFDEADVREALKKYSFFNWFFFAINMGVLLGITVMVYLEEELGWGWGFGVPAGATMVSVVVLLAGAPFYRYQRPTGSALTRFMQVVVAACRNHARGVALRGVVRKDELYEVRTRESDIVGARKLPHTAQYRFLDKAAVVVDRKDMGGSRWNLCTVTQVEEFKSFVRVLPIWASTIALSISYSQLSTFFISQATMMDRRLGPHFTIPPGCVPVFAAINGLILVPLYEGLAVPVLRRFTGHRRGLTSLQRMGVGLSVSIVAMASAAVVEKWRRGHDDPRSLTVFWLLPQFFLMGSAEVFTYVGQLEFFYDEATDGTRSLSSAMFLSEIGIGSWLSTALVKIIVRATGGEDSGWLRNNLNESKLDRLYWILCGINAINFCVYLVIAWLYKGRDGRYGRVTDESGLGDEMGDEEEGSQAID